MDSGFDQPSLIFPQQIRQLHDIRRHSSGFVLGETPHDPASGLFVFEIDKADVLAVGGADLEGVR